MTGTDRRHETPQGRRPDDVRLGATLRATAESAKRLGDANRWRPAPNSGEADVWDRAPDDPVALTLCESDLHAVLLLRSGLDHAAATARALSAGSPFLPHTLGRTATEHLARAEHHLEGSVGDDERVVRRLNELLFAIDEGEHRRSGIIRHSHLPEADAGRGRDTLHAELADRVAALGHSIEKPRRGHARIEGTPGRASAMSLVERSTAGTAKGIPSFTTRGASAVVHGTELGLLSCTRPVTDTPADHIQVPTPQAMKVGDAAFSLLGVLLTVINATDAIATLFGWPVDGPVTKRYGDATAKAVAVWTDVLNRDD